MKKQNLSKTIIYQAPNGAIELKGDLSKETVWANRTQMSEMFGVNPQAISKHIQNIYRENELTKEATSSKMELVQNESGREVKRQVDYYNLDVLIAVGYRINSVVGTKFRRWATQTLRKHITEGYTINKKVLQNNYNLFQNALSDIQKISQNKLNSNAVLELVKVFSNTWFSLDAFDKDQLAHHKTTSKNIQLESEQLYKDIEIFKQELQSRGEANELFAQEKENGSLEGIFGNIFQTAFGQDVYPSIEAKASNLLYFIVKNHPFNDGNKRTGAFTFIWFLQKAKLPFHHKITPEALTAITLLIATSNPKDKQKMIDLVSMMLSS